MTTNEGITAMVMVPISEASKYMVDTVVEVNFKVVA
jgi:hypothetical protein